MELRRPSFSSLESELSFDSKDFEINFDRALSTTVKSLPGVLRALCNISSDDWEDLFVDELQLQEWNARYEASGGAGKLNHCFGWSIHYLNT